MNSLFTFHPISDLKVVVMLPSNIQTFSFPGALSLTPVSFLRLKQFLSHSLSYSSLVVFLFKEALHKSSNREGNGTPLQYSCLENPMGGGAWWAAVHGVAKSRTWLHKCIWNFPQFFKVGYWHRNFVNNSKRSVEEFKSADTDPWISEFSKCWVEFQIKWNK